MSSIDDKIDVLAFLIAKRVAEEVGGDYMLHGKLWPLAKAQIQEVVERLTFTTQMLVKGEQCTH